MGKTGKLLPEEYKQKAIDNDLNLQTVYRRLERGWDIERAVTEKAKNTTYNYKRTEDGSITTDRPKSEKTRAFINYADNEELYQKALDFTGKTSSQFVADLVDQWLKRNKKKITS